MGIWKYLILMQLLNLNAFPSLFISQYCLARFRASFDDCQYCGAMGRLFGMLCGSSLSLADPCAKVSVYLSGLSYLAQSYLFGNSWTIAIFQESREENSKI
jgi:hypothetical protein